MSWMANDLAQFKALPGHELVEEGVDDLRAGRETAPALLVSAASPRLRAVGIDVPPSGFDMPSHRLYRLLAAADARTAHGKYNSLVRRMVSFARAAEGARAR
jgi:hypothetical protein